MARIMHQLRRNCRGASLIELAASVFILMVFVIAIAKFAALAIDTDRDGRAIRSGVDLVWQLDEETAAPTQAEADALRQALAGLARLGAADDLQVHFSLFRADSSDIPQLAWTMTSGDHPSPPPSRAAIDGSDVVVDAARYQMRDDEKLIVVEMIRSGRGMGEMSKSDSYSFGVAYKRDLLLGP